MRFENSELQLTEHLNFCEGQITSSGESDRDHFSLDTVASHGVSLLVGFVHDSSTPVISCPNFGAVDAVLTAVHSVIDKNHVDVVGVV
jgi:hypothetical protein